MKKFTMCLKILLIPALCSFLCAFSVSDSVDECLVFLQKSLSDHYDFSQESSEIKRYELNVTNNGFCRYKRYFNNGKIEYFAFKLVKFKDMNYDGTTVSGKLYLKTKNDDVIVQTYNDKEGDVDSMATQVIIPVKNMEAEELNLIRKNLEQIIVPKTVVSP